jgi:hypothetical protein
MPNVTWNAAQSDLANATLSNGNLTVTSTLSFSGVYQPIFGAPFFTAGKFYWEISVDALFAPADDVGFGFGNPSAPFTDNQYLGIDANSWGWYPNGNNELYNGVSNSDMDGPLAVGQIISFALDLTNKKWWARINANAWNVGLGGTQDPASNQGGFTLPSGLYTTGLAPAVVLFAGGDAVTARFSSSAWTNAPPSGFTSMNGGIVQNATALIAGVGHVSAALQAPINATIHGLGSVTVAARLRAAATATIGGVGSVSFLSHGPINATVNIGGTGSVTAIARVIDRQARATIHGAGNVNIFIDPSTIPVPPFVPPPVVHVAEPIDRYLDLVPDYNSVQPNFMATLRATLQPFVDQQQLLAGMPQQFDLDTAIGTQLDQVGIWIGRSRFIQTPITNVFFSWDIPGLGWEQGTWQGTFDSSTGTTRLDDETYRQLLYAKVAANNWDGSPEGIVTILQTLFANQGLGVTVVDNNNMSMSVNVTGTLNSLIFRALVSGGYIPIKPVGVSITYNLP